MFLRKKGFATLVALLCIAGLIASCGPAVDNDVTVPDEPQEVTIAVAALPQALSAGKGTFGRDTNVKSLINFGLVQWDENMIVEPLVAQDIVFLDDTTIVFELHEGILFHDGVEMTSADVKYTYSVLLDEDYGHLYRSRYAPIKEIVTPDPYTVEFHLHEPNAPLLSYMNAGIMPQHIGEEKGVDFLDENPVGIGPYKLVDWSLDEHIILEAFDDCFWGRPVIDKITFREIPEVSARLIELEAGTVDLIDFVPPEDVERLEGVADIRLDISPGTGLMYAYPNHEVPPLDDVKVRRALAHLIDETKMVDHVLRGQGELAYSPIVPSSWAYNADVVRYEFDPEKAQELLAEAGYPDGLELTLEFYWPLWREMAEIMQHDFAAGGVDLNVVQIDRGVWFEEHGEGNFELAILSFGSQVEPDRGVREVLHSRNIAPAGANFSRYSNSEVDALIEEASRVFDIDERTALYHEIQRIVTEDVAWLGYGGAAHTISAHTTRLQNFRFNQFFMFRQLYKAHIE